MADKGKGELIETSTEEKDVPHATSATHRFALIYHQHPTAKLHLLAYAFLGLQLNYVSYCSPVGDEGKEELAQASPAEISTTDATPMLDTKEKGLLIIKKPDVVDITDIKEQDLQKELHVRVYRKWASRNVLDPNPTGLCLILLEKRVSTLNAVKETYISNTRQNI